jgi:hypothetical protein
MKSTLTATIFIAPFLFICFSSNAQTMAVGTFVEKGFGASASLSSSDGVTTIGVDGGYVFNPTTESGFRITRTSYHESDESTTGFGPAISVFPLRQTEVLPVSIALSANYLFLSFSSADDYGIRVQI